jgi:hypothetical protein
MWTLVRDLDAFLQEHRWCGELDAGVEDDRVWMTCDGCGAWLARSPEARSARLVPKVGK